MARLKNGTLSGLIGNVVSVHQDGRTYFRKAPTRSAPPTEGELASRFQLELLAGWLKPLLPFLRKGFRNYSRNFQGFNAAFSVNYREALQKNGLESGIDPSLIKVSSGALGLSDPLVVLLSPEKILEFSWSPAIGKTQGPRDRVMLLAYNPGEKQAVFELSGTIRTQGHDRLSLSEAPPGPYHIYTAFAAEDGSKQSDSQYLGYVII